MTAEADKLIALRDAFRCQAYNCLMSLQACASRQRNAQLVKSPRSPGHIVTKPGFGDINCRDCAQGRENMALLKEQGMDDKQKIQQIIEDVCREYHLRPENVNIGRRGKHSIARKKIIYRLEDEIGTLSQDKMGQMLGISGQAISQILKRRKKESAKTALSGAKTGKEISPAPIKTQTVLNIDFADYPQLLVAVRRIAAAEVRTPEGQILYWLKSHVHHHEETDNDGP